MREIDVDLVRQAVKEACIDISYNLPKDLIRAMESARDSETWELAESTLDLILENAKIASGKKVPSCQDTGQVVVYVNLGQEVRLVGGSLEDAINQGISEAFREGYLRMSVIEDPLFYRKNTEDNTPGVIYYSLVPGQDFRIQIATKGFGSENMSRLKMLRPSDGLDGVVDFVLETVELAGPNACPPLVIGLGLGGTMDKAAWLAKKALMRSLDSVHPMEEYAQLEANLLDLINQTGIGPQGYGGRTTALRVFIESYPTHIAGLPIAVNINCHAARHTEVEL